MNIDCPICLETIFQSNIFQSNIFQSDCQHNFHRECIIKYCEYNNLKQIFPCPLCRQYTKITQTSKQISIDDMEIGKIYKAQRLHMNYDTGFMYVINEYNCKVDMKGISLAGVPYIISGYEYLYDNIYKFLEI
jgi:hypothetical protein